MSEDLSTREQQEIDGRNQAIAGPQAFLRNAPWLSIAILLHALLITILSVLYFTSTRAVEKEPVLQLSAVRGAQSELPPIDPRDVTLDRNLIPDLTAIADSAESAEEQYIPDAAPGRSGEITAETDVTKEPGIYNPDPDALADLPSGATGATSIGVGKEGHHGDTSAYVSRKRGKGGPGGGGPGGGAGAVPRRSRTQRSSPLSCGCRSTSLRTVTGTRTASPRCARRTRAMARAPRSTTWESRGSRCCASSEQATPTATMVGRSRTP